MEVNILDMWNTLRKMQRSFRGYFQQTILFSAFSLLTAQQIPSKKYLNSKRIQTWRIERARKLINSRRQKQKEKYASDLISFEKELNSLERDGIVIIRDFLPDNCLEEIKKYREKSIDNGFTDLKHFKLRGAEYMDGVIEKLLPATFDFLRQSHLVNILPKVYLGRNTLPQTWRLKYIRDLPEQIDENCFNHSDTFHNTLKIWIYLDDLAADEDTLKFWKRSHLPNEYIDSLRLQELLNGNGSPRLEENVMLRLGYEKFDQSIKANSIIIADTYGFHFRNYCPLKTKWRPTIFSSLRYSPLI